MTELTCHYCDANTREKNGPVVGWLIRVSDRWERPVCAKHMNVLGGGYPDAFRTLEQPRLRPFAEPCGSWVITAIIEGHPSEERWCERRGGPCPFPNAIQKDTWPVKTIDREPHLCQDEQEKLYIRQQREGIEKKS